MRLPLVALVALCLAALPVFAATPDSRQRAAETEAGLLLAAAQLPDGAQPLSAEPGGDGGALAAPMQPVSGAATTKTAFFRTSQSVSDVVGWLEAHPPAGTRKSITGSAESTDGRTVDYRAFDKPAVAHRFSLRRVFVSVTKLDDGSSGIRVDAEVVSVFPRSVLSRIHGARHLMVRVGKRHIQITDRKRVASFQRLFNSADFQAPAAPICPVAHTEPPHPRLTFRNRLGRVIAYAHIRPTGCARADIVVNHHRFEALDLTTGSGAKLLDALRRLGALPKS